MSCLTIQEIVDMIQTFCYSDASRRILISMVGIPGSGKSTAANYLAKHLGFECVEISEIRKEMKDNMSSDEKFADKIVFDEGYKRLKNALETKGLAIYNATNSHPRWRRKTNMITNYYYDISICVYMDTGIMDCLTRNSKSESPIETSIIERMYSNLCRYPPAIDEGYDIIFRCKEFD